MSSIIRRCVQLFAVFAAIFGSFPVQAGYDFTIIDYPNAVLTQLFGINNSGFAVGEAVLGDGSTHGFVYEIKTRAFIDVIPGMLGINDSDVIVGVTPNGLTGDSGFILDKKAFTLFSHPNFENTDARAISDSGLVTGYAFDSNFFGSTGFIYDSKQNSFVDIFFPNAELTIAQGINGDGDVVGSANLPVGGAYAASPAGEYGFLRDKHGAITLFRVNDTGNRTYARGITDSGRVTGYFADPLQGGGDQGFVADLDATSGFHLLQITSADLVNVPGAAETIPEAIDNSGRIVGVAVDSDGFFHGFIATPNGKK